MLGRFVAASQDDDEYSTSLGVVDPVAWAEVDFELTNAIGQDTMLPRVAVRQAIDADLDPGSADSIS